MRPLESTMSSALTYHDSDFSQNRISGTISNSIGSLTALTTLYFGGIQFRPGSDLTGTIPSSIGSCTRLQYLCVLFARLSCPVLIRGNPRDFALNRLTGTIPPSIGSLTALNQQLYVRRVLSHCVRPHAHLNLRSMGSNQLSGTSACA